MKKEFSKLNKWLQHNSKTKLAYLLGYEDTQAIQHWVKVGQIPRYQRERVMLVISADKETPKRAPVRKAV